MNYICFGGRWTLRYCYVDCHNYLADALFDKRQIPVRFGDEYRKDNKEYRVIFCKIKRKYKDQFEKALMELPNKMLLYGYKDYEKFCHEALEDENEKE